MHASAISTLARIRSASANMNPLTKCCQDGEKVVRLLPLNTLSCICSVLVAAALAIIAPKALYGFALQPGLAVLFASTLASVGGFWLSRSLSRVGLAYGVAVASLFVDFVTTVPFMLQMVAGVILSLSGLVLSQGLPRETLPVKVLFWLNSTYVQSVWIFNLVQVEQKMSFFGSHGIA